MTRAVQLYCSFLLVLAVGWIVMRAGPIGEFLRSDATLNVVGMLLVYLASHVCRMFRLTLLTLDQREKAFPLVAAHALTAFPSSFLPFKLGEILRLGAFFHVYDRESKAFVIWLTERFGDVLVLTAFVIGMQMFGVVLPDSMRAVCTIFAFASAIGLIGAFAVAKISMYLNRHLVLTSSSTRGLTLLRTSYALRGLESAMYRSVEGRITAFLMSSVMIWLFEIIALSLFIRNFAQGTGDFAQLFAAGMFASLPGGSVAGANAFGFYQSLALVFLTAAFLVAVFLLRPKSTNR